MSRTQKDQYSLLKLGVLVAINHVWKLFMYKLMKKLIKKVLKESSFEWLNKGQTPLEYIDDLIKSKHIVPTNEGGFIYYGDDGEIKFFRDDENRYFYYSEGYLDELMGKFGFDNKPSYRNEMIINKSISDVLKTQGFVDFKPNRIFASDFNDSDFNDIRDFEE